MHFDWTVTFGDILKLMSFAFGLLLIYGKLVKFVTKIEWMMDEFPPHKHIGNNNDILYPRGMEPRSIAAVNKD